MQRGRLVLRCGRNTSLYTVQVGRLEMDRDECLSLEDASPPRDCLLSHRQAGAGGIDWKWCFFPNHQSQLEERRGCGSWKLEIPLAAPGVHIRGLRTQDLQSYRGCSLQHRQEHLPMANSHYPHHLGPLKRLQKEFSTRKRSCS